MILVDENGDVEAYGLNAGLNKRARKNGGRGTKVGRFLRKNVNLKTAVKLAPMIAVGVATGGAGGVGLAVLKKGVAKTAGKALIKKVAKGAAKKMFVKTIGKSLIKKVLPFVKTQATRMITNRSGAVTATNEVVVSEPVGDLTPVRPVEPEAQAVEVETSQTESEPVGDLTPVKPVEEAGLSFVKEATATTTPTETKPNYLLYGGIGLGVLALGYFATKKAN